MRERLEQLQKRMKQFGMKGEQGFDEADEAMQEAEEGLGKGDQRGKDQAVDAQGRALEGLRKRRAVHGAADAAGRTGRRPRRAPAPAIPTDRCAKAATSPTPTRSAASCATAPIIRKAATIPSGPPAAERAQRVLEELRRRFSDPSRPREELDYLERLLRRY